ncbi:amino acid permease [Legionella jordanis]|uniref:Amino acid transporter PotE n=1 Tax=Legionella jordanis TaxID=456 RepID=A0A0W0VDI3_9GAMM|nr:amino acid permease [Legionella jordanis]KTD17910.1 amino acid transporter PotE [Legionella jordanis]RMX02391.1 amino acid permease [Legionella jordanis]RMX21767.1 amino acid permease [Legionella jordanis]VEH13999.1 basic amino acid/polyamine antiporter, APA family [Legionella jordanis]HAT8713880.1 amino acid permease [Legionella jordanis]
MDLFRKKAVAEMQAINPDLLQVLSALDLIFLGVGAIIGAGIFVLTGIVAATQAGPAIILSYVIAGFACAFAALSYAELAAAVGGCGSAYGYAYVGFGEIIAWIVGWDLLLEYSISVSAVSVGWSGYFNDFLKAIHLGLPKDFIFGPGNGGIFNLAAFTIIVLLGILLSLGVKFSSRFNNLMVIIKLLVIVLFIVVAITDVKPENWFPFMPFGWQGVVEGASLIFFAYIGFDAVSTTAEEAINPQRDLPIGIIGSLLICTVLYIIVSGLLTGIAHYSSLNVASPISHTLLMLGHRFVAGLIGVGAVAGLTTVMLVLYYGLTRVFLAMARDGLLPPFFFVTNSYTRTPIRIIVLCGIVMSLTAGLVPIDELAQLVNVGTLFAFIVVCLGVLILRYTRPDIERPFKTPLMPIVPILGVLSCAYLLFNLPWVTMLRFGIWMAFGLIIYWVYSRYYSHLNLKKER